jgi:hypothetical protein
MAAEDKSASRGTIATVVATAAVTLALGVTGAALGGYLVPPSGGAPPEQAAPSASSSASSPASEQGAEGSSAPRVVLVPIAPAALASPEGAPATRGEGLQAAYRPAGGDDATAGYDGDGDDGDGDDGYDDDDADDDDDDDDGGHRFHERRGGRHREGEHDDD